MLEVHSMPVGPVQANCIVLVNDQKSALIVDPGGEAKKLIHWIKDHDWQPQAILLTHAHFDHIAALDEVREAFGIEAYLHEIEASFLEDPSLNLSASMLSPIIQAPADHLWTSMGEKTLGDFKFKVAHVPGHSPGHVIYIFDQDRLVVNGDTVFQGSIGRTDFDYGDFMELMTGIGREIISLPHDYQLYPGHGESTTIQAELETNPFFDAFRQGEDH